MTDSVLYLLRCTDLDAFKIGVSNNVVRRLKSLPQKIDHERSLQIPIEDGGAGRIERFLHHLFRASKQKMPLGDGHTEWFEGKAWPAVLEFLDSNAAGLGAGQPETIVLPAPQPPAPDTEAKRLARKAEAERLERLGARATTECGRVMMSMLDAIFSRNVSYAVFCPAGEEHTTADIYMLGTAAEINDCWDLYRDAVHTTPMIVYRHEMQGSTIGNSAVRYAADGQGALRIRLHYTALSRVERDENRPVTIEGLLRSRQATSPQAVRAAERIRHDVERLCG